MGLASIQKNSYQSSRDHGSTIHEIEIKNDNFITQIMHEVQFLRDENKSLKT